MSIKIEYQINSDGRPLAVMEENDVQVEVVGMDGDDLMPVVDSIVLLAANDGLQAAAQEYLERGLIH